MIRLALAGLLLATIPARAQDSQRSDLLERGRYLAVAGDCTACHTVPGGTPFAGGRAIDTPFGRLLTPNLTPDRETGLGAWSDDDFVRAMQHGIAPGDVHLYPALPYPYYTKVSRDDLLAIRAWLGTLDPVRNAVEVNQLPFPFEIRAELRAWDALFFKPGEFQPRPDKGADWNRGAYLVEGLGHCGGCHTAKNRLGGDETSHALQGGSLQDWYAPGLGADLRSGLGAWSADDIVAYLKTGSNGAQLASGPMAEVVTNSTSRMTGADLYAISTYLKDLPASQGEVRPVEISDPTMVQGRTLYLDNCGACHTSTGVGANGLFPRLQGSSAVQSPDPATLVRVVLQGTRAVATPGAPTGPAMPGFAWRLDDQQAAAVVTYIRNAWGNAAPAVTPASVNSARTRLARERAE